MWWERLKTEVLDTDLYTRSGTEVGVSRGTLTLEEKDGDFFVVKNSEGDIPSICFEASTDKGIDYPELNRFVFGKLPDSWLIGNFKRIYVGYWNEEDIRANAASGGIMSGIQNYLLSNGEIEGAITLRMSKTKPYLTEPIIAQTREQILEGAQSKYTTAPLNQILADLPGNYSSLAYTGLPEEVAAIRYLQRINHPAVKPIRYILGSFYGEAIGISAIKSFLRSHGVKNLNELVGLSFRAGEWPGNMRVVLNTGRTISMRKFHANYLIPSHITKFSLYQVDYMSELADISCGDAWAPRYESRGGGWSVILARTDKGLALIERLITAGAISAHEISARELIEMHSHGLDFKKRGAFIRMALREKMGLPVPYYGYGPVNMPKSRVTFEKFLGLLLALFQNSFFIWFLEKLPTRLVGWLFIKARNFWKKSTKPAKRGGLLDLKFSIHGTIAET